MLQALERVNSSLDVSHFIIQSTTLAATRYAGFVVIGKRHLPKERSDFNEKIISIFKVAKDDLDNMWQLATPQVINWDLLFTDDGPALWHTIMFIGTNPVFCRVYLKGWSISRVYVVGFPSMYTFPDGIRPDEDDAENEDKSSKKKSRTYPGIPTNGYSLALKVIKDQDSFQRENIALQAIARQYQAEDRIFRFYAIGFIDFSLSPLNLIYYEGQQDLLVTLSPELQQTVFDTLKNITEPSAARPWWNESPPSPTRGGVILMRVGENISDFMEPRELFDGALESLHVAHRAGFCHRDLRKPNLLIFDGKVQVVDFGDAIAEKIEVEQQRGGARENFMPIRVKNLQRKEVYPWKKDDDIEMLARAICFCN